MLAFLLLPIVLGAWESSRVAIGTVWGIIDGHLRGFRSVLDKTVERVIRCLVTQMVVRLFIMSVIVFVSHLGFHLMFLSARLLQLFVDGFERGMVEKGLQGQD